MKNISELPVWSFDGSCSYLAEGNNSDVYLHPVALYRDPFRSAAFWFLDLHSKHGIMGRRFPDGGLLIYRK